MTFSLKYRGIPLSSTSCVVILLSGDKLAIDRRNIPTPAQLPADNEIAAYLLRREQRERNLQRGREQVPESDWEPAVAVARDDFRERAKAFLTSHTKIAPAALPDEWEGVLVGGDPRPGIWLPDSGRGRIAYRFALAPKAPTIGCPGSVYWVEAVAEHADRPRILARIERVFRFQGVAPSTYGVCLRLTVG